MATVSIPVREASVSSSSSLNATSPLRGAASGSAEISVETVSTDPLTDPLVEFGEPAPLRATFFEPLPPPPRPPPL
eukprot:CAMPEP_0119498268 /NCGR_PEP_ID=MMETSP1344-20130328/21060_1 /TAXON_ID=236787 /ORGANISM="Florenciella parvula, Strain CCMP2471" /LENGTH=75 /DNA_ID=CAMNT_0007534129 /DNA_START=231 /DNA_END=455 /DNA_ORIENTATION=+